MKKCCHCKIDLSLDSFQKNRAAPDGLQYRCKDCTSKASKVCRAKRGHLWLEKTNPWGKRLENRLQVNATERARRANNPDKIRKENRAFRERNPFSVATCVANNRARKLGVLSTLTAKDWKQIVEQNDFCCHVCGDKVSLEIGSPLRLSLDHILPLSRGGLNVKENVLPAHRRCNQSRNDMTLEEFDAWLEKISLHRRSG